MAATTPRGEGITAVRQRRSGWQARTDTAPAIPALGSLRQQRYRIPMLRGKQIRFGPKFLS
jgi:hypothetical protein